MHYVYILKLSNNSNYVGQTSDLKNRIKDHNKGNTNHTKKFLPVKLIFYCAFESKKKALNFEKYLKSGSGKAFKKKRLI
ncbi:excinuclease ABC subunit C [Candidatus Woesebacteria bacterium RIFCSPLOWO2_01_FULL_39_23]|uniref:Excinuclease ABC subunit C n=1 Tax=Candidatus Woesebacteria bacterium RIFCSPHIGHO2_01_FULL_40_22 TaxID=1802499 RepID=A0A1F7YHW4_9BACT|nr:MAG: excinuclease ABC subunit C [Candidatus Woesebacteria bacterium RBG_16_40_11]OGM26469.1 MAG: excinuclease ABC subunit C [Candidatus Woesebacteria bacterium RIFCSPHIGHO2_01_FULL_40_22]OGM37638.1 MAG: excinuclease ABC subunit C [Candidatus Woesebacteria bacterium RIFCSPHIGHO2_12_FULL_38_9]OGM62922.1 MAG: excinuclease ABC subunit C [Candidatus Woesebacteria bacterium RIFCSPLOWO2_01_FULL_39_23]